MINFGDSITVGIGASTAPKSWVGLYAPINQAAAGSQAAEVSNAALSASDTNYTLMIGTNDVRIYKDSIEKQAHFKRFLRGILSALCHPVKTIARNMTATGTWVNTSVNSIGRYTLTNGAKLSCTVTGSKIFVNYIIQANTLAISTGDVYIDSVLVGSISCDGQTNLMTTQNGLTYGSGCEVFNVAEGEHLVEIINTSANGKYFYINYVSTNQTEPLVKISNIIKLGASTYTSLGITSATTDAYNAIINNVITDFCAILIDNYSDINPAIHLSDGVHPNDAGHLIIHNNFK